ncbi:MAG: hypothetical protein CVU56_00615 [Deltaproteobacteria bacterium HGW-Deltaproteobacteria-14]|nr:MAG: hypothetical protein CVU56_00615 [Deltaproteobacteria bacterium HGW-Deltaproteobacteria-14]
MSSYDQRGVHLELSGVPLSTVATAALRDEGFIPWRVALSVLDEACDLNEVSARLSALDGTFSEEDRSALEAPLAQLMPPTVPMTLSVAVRGVAGRTRYALLGEWVGRDGYRVDPPPERLSPGIVRWRESDWRITASQLEVLDSLDGVEGLGANRSTDLAHTERVTSAVLGGDASVTLGPGLRSSRFVRVDAVAPMFAQAAPGRYRMMPTVEGITNETLWGQLRRSRGAEQVVSYRDPDGVATRVVFTSRAQAAIADVRREAAQMLTPRRVAQIMTRPQDILGENLDLSGLSERVTGFGPVVLDVSFEPGELGGRDWWDFDTTLVLDDGVDTSLALDLRDENVVRTLETAIAAADADGSAFIPCPNRDALMPLTALLRQAVATARERLDGLKPERAEPQGFQIIYNIEELEFEQSEVTPGGTPPRKPRGLAPGFELHDHQLVGFSWLHALATAPGGSRGALLADDMGLGKTLQVLALLSDMLEGGRPGPHLVVGPVAVLTNWMREARRFFQERLPCLQIQGQFLRGASPAMSASALQTQRVVVASYETLRVNEIAFAKVKWDTVILDEAQKAKNPTTQIARVLRTLQARFRLAVTGTPVENSLRDLWTLYDWAVPGLLGPLRQFRTRFMKPLGDGADSVQRRVLADELTSTIKPVFMRRLKEDALQGLPPIHRHDHVVPLSHEQELMYAAVIRSVVDGREKPLGSLPRLFGMCAHPDLTPWFDDLRALAASSFPKGQKLFELLDDVAARGEKALVFANRKAVQRWIADEVARRYQVARPFVINGCLDDSAERLRLVDLFQSRPGFGCIVLAPRAAGVGLNITAANHVIHYMREWNPAVENQATDRCYRIGQVRPVHVHTITARSPRGVTVEERLAELLEAKRRLFADFIVPLGDVEVAQSDLVNTEGWDETTVDGDADLFTDAMWPVLRSVLEADASMRAEPPCEHLDGGRVIGLDDGTLFAGTKVVRLVDGTRRDADRLEAALRKKGESVEVVDTRHPTLAARALGRALTC